MATRIVRDSDGKPQLARTPDGRFINEDGTLGMYDRFTDAARAWIVGNPKFNDIRTATPDSRLILETALHMALAEDVNYIDVTHLEEAERSLQG